MNEATTPDEKPSIISSEATRPKIRMSDTAFRKVWGRLLEQDDVKWRQFVLTIARSWINESRAKGKGLFEVPKHEIERAVSQMDSAYGTHENPTFNISWKTAMEDDDLCFALWTGRVYAKANGLKTEVNNEIAEAKKDGDPFGETKEVELPTGRKTANAVVKKVTEPDKTTREKYLEVWGRQRKG